MAFRQQSAEISIKSQFEFNSKKFASVGSNKNRDMNSSQLQYDPKLSNKNYKRNENSLEPFEARKTVTTINEEI